MRHCLRERKRREKERERDESVYERERKKERNTHKGDSRVATFPVKLAISNIVKLNQFFMESEERDDKLPGVKQRGLFSCQCYGSSG